MATTAFKGNPVHTVGELPTVGSQAPGYRLVGAGLSDLTETDQAGKRVVLNIFPSVDTGICAESVRRFNAVAGDLDNTVVLNVSADLPFAQARFCGAEGIDNVVVGSAFRSDFGQTYGVTMADGPMAGLLARSVIVVDADRTVKYVQLVDEITTEPDYDAALAALG